MDDDDDWRPEPRRRVAKWVMVFAIVAFAVATFSGVVSIIIGR